MVKIAICDDEPRDLEALGAMLSNYMERAGATLVLQNFGNGFGLLRALESGAQFDVIFLDVLMPGLGGIQTAQELRQTDANTELVFLTQTPDFALDAFSVKARDYLVKPLDEATLFSLMDELSARLDESDDVVINYKKGLRRLRCDRIEYCEVLGHTVIWHLRSGAVLESFESIQSVEKKLSHSGMFCRVHRSFLVNLNCISSFNRATGSVQLESMTTVPVSRAKFAEIQQQYIVRMKKEPGI